MSPSGEVGVARKAGSKSLKSGSAGRLVVRARILSFCSRRSARLAAARSRSRSWAVRRSASSRKWTDDQVTPMVKINSTLLIEVLLIWMPKRPISTSSRNS